MNLIIYISLAIIAALIYFVFRLYKKLKELEDNTPRMVVFEDTKEALLLTPDYEQKLTEYKIY